MELKKNESSSWDELGLNRPVWICLIGGQILPNVLPVLPFRPNKVYLINTDDPRSQAVATNLLMFYKKTAYGTKAYATLVPAFDRPGVVKTIKKLESVEGTDNILLNWTGGTKIMSNAALLAVSDSVPKLYYDTRQGISMDKGETWYSVPTSPLNVPEYILLNETIKKVEEKEFVHAPESTSLLIEKLNLLNRNNAENLVSTLCGYRGQISDKMEMIDQHPTPPFQTQNGKFIDVELSKRLLEAMKVDKLLVSGPDSLAFHPNPKGVKYLHGLWWEGIILAKIKQGMTTLGIDPGTLDVRTNLEIYWKSGTVVKNEIDISFVYSDRLYLVSCTTSNMERCEKRRKEVEDFSQRFGGVLGKAMLACTQNRHNINRLRARKNDTTSIPYFSDWENPETILKSWFSK